MTINGNTITIGSIEQCGTGLQMSGSVHNNNISVGKITECAQGVLIGDTLQSKLGLPEETDIQAIKEALISLRDNPECTIEEKQKALKPLAIWKVLERSADVSTVISSMTALLATPQVIALLAGI